MGMNDFMQFFRGMGGKIGSNVLAGVHGQTSPQNISFLRQLEKELRQKDDLSCPLDKLEVVVFDIETTGFSPEKDKIISIGAVKMKGSELSTQHTFYSLIRSDLPLPPEISALTNIHNDELRVAPEASDVLIQFFKFISSRILIAHHSMHELNFMQKLTREISRTRFQHRIIDTSFLTRLFDTSTESRPLEKICLECGVEVQNRHNALGDALMTAEIWSYYIKQAQTAGFNTLQEVYEHLAKQR